MQITMEQWEEVKKNVKFEYNIADTSYDTWIKDLKLYSASDDDVAVVLIPTEQAHAKSYIECKYKNCFVSTMNKMFEKKFELEFTVDDKMLKIDEYIDPKKREERKKKEYRELAKTLLNTKEIYYESNLNHVYTFDSFVAGDSNKFAYSASLAVAEAPERYTILFIYTEELVTEKRI